MCHGETAVKISNVGLYLAGLLLATLLWLSAGLCAFFFIASLPTPMGSARANLFFASIGLVTCGFAVKGLFRYWSR